MFLTLGREKHKGYIEKVIDLVCREFPETPGSLFTFPSSTYFICLHIWGSHSVLVIVGELECRH